MPRPALPPTPVSSTDIIGRDGQHLTSLDPSFSLGPAAIAGRSNSASSTSTKLCSYRPTSPTSPVTAASEQAKTRRQASIAEASKDDFSLPPPPTRARKIIQMKPQTHVQTSNPTPREQAATAAKNVDGAGTQSRGGSKKKQPSATSVAGRKIARKTAHSLIERRRRSKMNEEFGILQQMIPACRDQEMHKLAILQASIDYTRYLEQCIADLKANGHGNIHTSPRAMPHLPSDSHMDHSASREESEDDDEMEEAPDAPSWTAIARQSGIDPTQAQSTPPTPYFGSQRSQASLSSISPVTEFRHHPASAPYSAFTSPVLLPQMDGARSLDHEATEALLMLNTDRRSQGGRGMSVQDLLSG
ncbi:MAG: hypothetical protein M1817_006851 [Caeruleum heppii]|nr:MAG: hypothetical protein M1817_006851 [Caeruleum heppii]